MSGVNENIPDGWVDTSLGELIDIKHGFAFKGKYISEVPNDNILVTPGNFSLGGGFKSEKLKFYYGDIPEDYILNADDIIVTMTDLSKEGDTLGYSALVPDGNKIYLHNQRIGLVIFKNEEFDKKFAYWLLRTRHYQKSMVNSSTGSTVSHTSPSRIQEYEFNLPPLPEQKAIANILTAFDDKIENLQAQNKTLEQTAQTIFAAWFGKYQVGDELPDGWRVGKYEDLVNLSAGKGVKKSDYIENGKYKIFGANGTIGYYNKYLIDEPVILTGRVGTLGSVFIFNEPIWISDNVLISKVKNKASFYYSFFTLKSFNFKSLNTGSTQPLITQTDLKLVPVIIR